MDKELTQEQKHQMEIVATLTPYLMALPQSKINEGSLVIYARALSSLSIAEIDAAMLKLMRTMRFFPSIAEIFEQAENIKNFSIGKIEKSSDEAWREVLREIHDAFIYREPKFSTPEIKQAALNMGWTSLCNLETDAINTARAQFMRIYDSILNRKKDNKVNGEVIELLPALRVKELAGIVTNRLKKLAGDRA